uniref:Uncharacterized protein n=1 Tax=Schistocephalus solidus TaxID=70667 RepID=A0A0X3NGI7_SCHSO
MEEHSEPLELPSEAEPILEASSSSTSKDVMRNDGLQLGGGAEEQCDTSSGDGEHQGVDNANKAPLNNLENTEDREQLHTTTDYDLNLTEHSIGVEHIQEHAWLESREEAQHVQPMSLEQMTNDQEETVPTSAAYESAETHVPNGYTGEEGTEDMTQAQLNEITTDIHQNGGEVGSEVVSEGDLCEKAFANNGERDNFEGSTQQEKEEQDMVAEDGSSAISQSAISSGCEAFSTVEATKIMHAEEKYENCFNEPVNHPNSVRKNDIELIPEFQIQSLVPTKVEDSRDLEGCEQPQVIQDDQSVISCQEKPIQSKKPSEYLQSNAQESVSQKLLTEDSVTAQPCTEMPWKITEYVQSKEYSPAAEKQTKEDEKEEPNPVQAEPEKSLLKEQVTSGKEDFEARYADFVGRILPGHDIYNSRKETLGREIPRGGTLHRHVDARSPYAVLWDTSNASLRTKSATLGARSRRLPTQPQPSINDDHLFPDSVTPSKVDKTLIESQKTKQYDVPFMDDDAFLPHRMRSKRGQGDEENEDSDSDSDYESGDFSKCLLEKNHLAHPDETSTNSKTTATKPTNGIAWLSGLKLCGCMRR